MSTERAAQTNVVAGRSLSNYERKETTMLLETDNTLIIVSFLAFIPFGLVVYWILSVVKWFWDHDHCKSCGSKESFVRTEENQSAHCPDCGASRAYQLEDRVF